MQRKSVLSSPDSDEDQKEDVQKQPAKKYPYYQRACCCFFVPGLVGLDSHDIPAYLQVPFIERGYRLNYGWKDAFFSLFQFHNETINIWTALLPMFLFFFFLVQVFFWNIDIVEKIMFIVYVITAILSFLSSTLFHWFGCMSERANTNFVRFDIAMIALLIGGSYFPPLFYGFECHPGVKFFYLALISCFAIAAVAVTLIPAFSKDEYRVYRIFVFSGIAAFGIFPISHLISLYGLTHELWHHISFIFLMYALYGIGVIFYGLRIPERFLRRRFDILFHSHQFWHLFVFLATLFHFLHCANMSEMNNSDVSYKCYGTYKAAVPPHSQYQFTQATKSLMLW